MKGFVAYNERSEGPSLFNRLCKAIVRNDGAIDPFKVWLSPNRPEDIPTKSAWQVPQPCIRVLSSETMIWQGGEWKSLSSLSEFTTAYDLISATTRYRLKGVQIEKRIEILSERMPLLKVKFRVTGGSSVTLAEKVIFRLRFPYDPPANFIWREKNQIVSVNRRRSFFAVIDCAPSPTASRISSGEESSGLETAVSDAVSDTVSIVYKTASKPSAFELHMVAGENLELARGYLRSRTHNLEKQLEERSVKFWLLKSNDKALDRGFAFSANYLLSNVLMTDIGWVGTAGDGYAGFWARDSMWTVKGLLRTGYHGYSRAILQNLARFQLDPENPNVIKEKTLVGRGTMLKTHSVSHRCADNDYFAKHRGAMPTTVFFNGAIEIYGKAPDIDSTALWLIEMADYLNWSGDLEFVRRMLPKIEMAADYLISRDKDKDGLVEQDENEDHADCLRRSGKVAYSQCVFYEAIKSAAMIEEALTNNDKSAAFKKRLPKIKAAFNKTFWLEKEGFYADFVKDAKPSKHLHQDTTLAAVFGLADPKKACRVSEACQRLLGSPYGHRVVAPGYKETKPELFEEGTYVNGGIWPWHSGFESLLMFQQGRPEEALEIIGRPLRIFTDAEENPQHRSFFSPYEWIHPVTGKVSGSRDLPCNCGTFIWNIVDGLFGVRAVYDRPLEMHPCLPKNLREVSLGLFRNGRWQKVLVKEGRVILR